MKLFVFYKVKTGLLALFAIIATQVGVAQKFMYQAESSSQGGLRLDYGLTLGGYLANRGTANYYNGSTPFQANFSQTKLEYIFSNIYYQEAIREQIGNYPFSLPADPYPNMMRYNAAITIGLFGAAYLSPSFGVIGEFNFASLKTRDRFALNVIRNPLGLEAENIMLIPIWGVEERYDMRLGLQYTILSEESQIHPFFELGASMTNTLVKENSIRVGSRTFTMHQPQSSLYFQERDYGIGFGGFATIGAKLAATRSYSLWAGYCANLNKINLGTNKQFLLQHTVFIRLSLASVL